MSSSLFTDNSELAFISILLKHPELLSEISSTSVSMMTSTPNQIVLASLFDVASQNLIPEKILLIDYLRSTGKLSLAGGEQYITYLFEQDFNVDNFPKFRDIVTDSYRARSIISAISSVPKLLTEGIAVDKVLSDLRYEIDKIDNRDFSKATFKISDRIQKIWDEIVSRTSNPGLPGISTGLRKVDIFTGGYNLGDYWVLGARPSQGKTSFICNSVLKSSLNGGIPLLFSLEMTDQTLYERLLALVSGVSLSSIRLGTLSQDELDSIHKAATILKGLPIYLDVNFSTNVSYATAIIRNYVKNFGVNVVWIDYVQLMSERGSDQTSELGKISRDMKLLAKDLGIFIGVAAQLNRLVEMRDDKRPVLSDLRQSGNLEEDADLVAFLYRDDYYYSDSKNKGLLEYIVRKNRNGPVGMIPLNFEKETTRITDD